MAQLVKSYGGLAIASVKSVKGLAIASAKSINGLDNTGGGGYTATSADFAGDGQCWIERDADFTGFADGKAFTLSFWFRLDGGNGAFQRFLYNGTGKVAVTRMNSNIIRMSGQDSAGNTLIQLETVATFTSGAAWHHIAISADKSVETRRHMYVDGVSDLSVVTFLSDDVDGNTENVDWARGDWAIGALLDGGQDFNGCLSEFVFHNTYVDLSNSTNLEKFRTSGGAPADIASTDPFGATPIVYLKGGGTGFVTNSGSGGDMVKKGTTALTTGSTSPP